MTRRLRIGLIALTLPRRYGPANGSISARVRDYIRITPDDCPTGADTTAPTTTATSAPRLRTAGGLVTSDVNVTLTGTDNANGSGVDKVEYKVDGGAFATYSAPVAITTDGTHTVEYRSTDKAGNVEATKSLTVKVDKAAPTTTATLEPATSPTARSGHADARGHRPRSPVSRSPSTRSTRPARSVR